MTCASDVSLEEFYAITRTRIPTALEFLTFIEAQGWRVRVGENGRAALQVPDRHCPLARSVARMLAREPYRSNVLALVMQRWRQKFTPRPAAAPEVYAPASGGASPAMGVEGRPSLYRDSG